MKKHIGFITLDFSLASWLSNALRTAPRTPAAQELLEGMGELMNGSTESLMLELGEREHAEAAEDLLRWRPLHRPEAAQSQPEWRRHFIDPKGV